MQTWRAEVWSSRGPLGVDLGCGSMKLARGDFQFPEGKDLEGFPEVNHLVYTAFMVQFKDFPNLDPNPQDICQVELEFSWALHSSYHLGVALTVQDSWLGWEF